jgi:hypothetical protein
VLKNAWVKSMFPYVFFPHHEGIKWDTIQVVRRTNAKLPHCTSLALVYPMENKMPLAHHAIKQWGCSCTIKYDRG